MRTKWIVALIEVDESRLGDLPLGRELCSLPDLLDGAVERLAPSGGLELHCLYLSTPPQFHQFVPLLERHSLPYHEYAVDHRGEACVEPDCVDHHSDAHLHLRLLN
jgi:hypothetical protein